MLDQFRTQKLEWNRANNQIYDRVEANSGDSNGRTLFVQILNDGMVEDLTGAVLSLAWKKRTEQGLEAFEEVDAKKGQFRLFYPTGMLENHGVLQASLVLVDVTGRIESKPFDIIVHKGTVDDEAVESDNKFTALTTALVKVSQVQAEFDGLYADKSQMMDTLHDDKKADMETLEADYSNRANTLETTYAPRLTEAESEIDMARDGATTLGERLDEDKAEVTAQLAQTTTEVNKHFMKPYFIEYFASFNKYGYGTPSGITNYTGGNYVLGVSGNAGDSFLTVTSGNIEDGGGKWACVLKNDDGLYDINKVISHDGANKITLYSPLKKNISNGILANLHDSVSGQHYTEHGYFAFAQHLYFSKPRYSERNSVLAQFLATDTIGKWTSNANIYYNSVSNMNNNDNIFVSIGSSYLGSYMSDATKYIEWEEGLNGYKGYIETFMGSETGKSKVEFFLDDILVDTKEVSKPVQRIVFPFEYAQKGKIRISVMEGSPYGLRIGRTTWFVNEKYSKETILSPSDKVVFMGDSWGEFHNKATTRELERLMMADGGSPIMFNYSKGGHTSTYARAWFDEYVIKNKPDKVIIEYFTNDFNSIRGTVLNPFINPSGQEQDMNIASLNEYVENIRYMIDRAIEHGIQPIVIMPASTEVSNQAQAFANFANDLWNGVKITNDTPFFAQATMGSAVTNLVEANGDNDIIIKAKAANSVARNGVKIDSDRNLTGGEIGGFYNNGVKQVGVKHNGIIEFKSSKLIPQQFFSSFPLDENGRGALFLLEQSNQDDILYIAIKKADGTYTRKKVQLID